MHKTGTHRAALAVHLHGHSVRQTDTVTPVAASHRDEIQLRRDDAATDGSGHLLGALGTKTDVSVLVTHQDVAHEAVCLTGRGHLLHWVDLHHLILQGAWCKEVIDDLRLLDGQGVQVDLLDAVDLAVVHEASELGQRHPGLLLLSLALSLALALSLLALALALALVAEAALAEASLTAHSGFQ